LVIRNRPEDVINEMFENDNDRKPNTEDWELINKQIYIFEQKYREILSDYVSGASYDEGHDSSDCFVGGCDASLKDIVAIMEKGEDVGGGEFVFTSSSGNFNEKHVENLDYVFVTLRFYLPTELVDYIDNNAENIVEILKEENE